MFHHVARAEGRRLLFTTWDEGLHLWRAVLQACPRPLALCIMPNHVHLLSPTPCAAALGRALSGFSRRWHDRHGTAGVLFDRSPPPEEVGQDVQKRRRVHRYILLNPCRAGLTPDPLAWPLSTALDDLGLADPPIRRPVRDPVEHFAYLTADDRVRAAFPIARVDRPPVDAIVRAVSQVTRRPLDEVPGRLGRPRALAIQAVAELHLLGPRGVAAELGVSKSAAARALQTRAEGVDRIARVAAADLPGLDDQALRRMLEGSVYRGFEPPPRRRRP